MDNSRSVREAAAELISLARERTDAWRAAHDHESLISGSADGWLVLATLDALIAEGERLRGVLAAIAAHTDQSGLAPWDICSGCAHATDLADMALRGEVPL